MQCCALDPDGYYCNEDGSNSPPPPVALVDITQHMRILELTLTLKTLEGLGAKSNVTQISPCIS